MIRVKHWLLVLLVLTACTQPVVPPPNTPSGGTYAAAVFDPDVEVKANRFRSAEELSAFIDSNEGADGRGFVGDVMVAEAATAGVAVQAKAAPDYSQTNVQVAGIDEADIVKTDGEYLYVVSGTTVFIVEAGDDPEILSTIDFDQRPAGLFVDGDRLAVFGNFYDLDYFKKHGLVPRHGMTYFNVYDTSDKEDPELEDEYKFEGRYFQSRMKDGWVYFVVTSGLEIRPLPMPIIMEGDVLRHVPVRDVYYYDLPYDSVQFATIHALRLDGQLFSKTVAVEGSQVMYMSHENIYITSTKWINEWELRQEIMIELLESELTDADRSLVRKIKRTDNDILSKREKQQKIMQIYQRYVQFMVEDEREELEDEIEKELKERLSKYESLEFTVIHKVGIDDGDIDVGPSGQVPGRIHNQFAMDEHNDVFRIATTVSPQRWWGGPVPVGRPVESAASEIVVAPPRRTESVNNVYTLDEELDILDKLEGLAEGERIFATRFMGERLYMVTFRQVDPFFVIDLSNPRNIKELGELKIPGFSRYLHPYDEDTIIGIGRDATETGRQQGIKISLFDVSDVSDPEEIANWVAKERHSQSTAEWEHKAFLFSKEKELLVIPAYSYDYSKYGGQAYNGAMVFKIEKDEIELRGLVDHSKAERRYGPAVQRSLYIENLLYTLSEGLLRVNDLDDLHSVANVTLTSADETPYPVY